MDRDFLTRAVSLWELSLGAVLFSIIAGAALYSCAGRVNAAKMEGALQEMSAVLEAAQQYDVLHGAWPASLGQLQEVLPRVRTANAWGYPYSMGCDKSRFWIQVQVPHGIVHVMSGGAFVIVQGGPEGDLVRLSTGRSYGQAWRLIAVKKDEHAP